MEGYLRRLAAVRPGLPGRRACSPRCWPSSRCRSTRGTSAQADFGYAETLLTLVILTSILLRAGIGEAFVRHWYDDAGRRARARRLARTTTSFVLITTTLALIAGLLPSPARCRG